MFVWIIATLIVLAATVAVVAVTRRSGGAVGGGSGGAKPRGIKQMARKVARDPAYMEAVGRELADRSQRIDAARAAPPPGAEQISVLVTALLDGDDLDATVAEIRLGKAGAAAAPALLAALDDPRCAWDRTDGVPNRTSGDRIVSILWPIAPRELGRKIGHLCNDPAWNVFNLAIKSRASIGTADLAPWMLSVLNDASHKNHNMRRDKLCEGINRADDGGWLEPKLVESLLQWCRSNATTGRPHPTEWALKFLLRHRREEAVAMLSGPLLSLENNHNIHFVLKSLADQGVKVPTDDLRAMLRKARTSDQWPWNCTEDAVVQALALSDLDEAIRTAEETLLNDKRSFSARQFLLKARGLPQPYECDPPESMQLSAGERQVLDHLSNVCLAHGEVCNGGLSQYFFNSSGEHWQRDAASLRAVGALEPAAALEQAASILSPGGASADRSKRIQQYADADAEDDERLDSLSEVFWNPATEAAIYHYQVRHQDLLRRVKAARDAAAL